MIDLADPELRGRVYQVFDEAVGLLDDERSAFLDESCYGDDALGFDADAETNQGSYHFMPIGDRILRHGLMPSSGQASRLQRIDPLHWRTGPRCIVTPFQ